MNKDSADENEVANAEIGRGRGQRKCSRRVDLPVGLFQLVPGIVMDPSREVNDRVRAFYGIFPDSCSTNRANYNLAGLASCHSDRPTY